MARIRSLETGRSDLRVHPTEVDATYHIIDPKGGPRLLQISTYGSDQRRSEPKVSQTFQIDGEVAKILLEVIEEAFPGVGHGRGGSCN